MEQIAAVEQSLKILFNEERLVLLPDTALRTTRAAAHAANPLIRETKGFLQTAGLPFSGSLPAHALRQGHLLRSFGDKAGKQGPQQLFTDPTAASARLRRYGGAAPHLSRPERGTVIGP